MTHEILNCHRDYRGMLFEAFRLTENPWVKMAYVVTIEPGYARDMSQWHYHEHKTEVFICLSGHPSIAIKDKGEVVPSLMWADIPCAVYVEPGQRHSLANLQSTTAVVLVLCDEYYDPEDELREPMTDWDWEKWQK